MINSLSPGGPLSKFKNFISKNMSHYLECDEEYLAGLITNPSNIEMGDFSLPCFSFAKKLKKSPQVIAEECKTHMLSRKSPFEQIKAVSGYINFYIDKTEEAKTVLEEIYINKETFGFSDIGQKKTITVDFSSPNIAKPIAFQHLRSTMIGNSICNILEFLNFDVKRINYLGDWGTNYGKLIVAFEKWGSSEKLKSFGVVHLVEIYQQFEKEKNEELENEARSWFKKMEDGDTVALNYWKEFREISLCEFKKTYKRLNVNFHFFAGESAVNGLIAEVVDEISEKLELKESSGAYIVEIGSNVPPVLIKKTDGASLYATRDITEAIRRKKQFKFTKNLYIVATQQNLHFKSVFTVLSMLGYDWSSDCEHVAFGMMLFNDKKMATRSGNVVYLEDVLDKAKELSLKIINEKNPDLEDKDDVAEKVGIGAIVFNDLKNKRIKDVNFNWSDVLNFDGETGPYVQYTYARIGSIFRKSSNSPDEFKVDLNEIDFKKLNTLEEIMLVKGLAAFPERLIEAAKTYEPSVIAKYLLELSSLFNIFYNKHKVISGDADYMKARLLLIYSTRQIIKSCSKLLGLPLPERM